MSIRRENNLFVDDDNHRIRTVRISNTGIFECTVQYLGCAIEAELDIPAPWRQVFTLCPERIDSF